MLSRVADSLYWMSRYLERAEHTARLLHVSLNQTLDQSPALALPRWARLLSSLGATMPEGRAHTPRLITEELTFSTNRASILACITAARDNARQVREQISSEMWEQLNELYLTIRNGRMDVVWDNDVHTFFRSVKDGAHLFQGITDATMSHSEGWHFIQLGRALERAGATTVLLDAHFKTYEQANDDHGIDYFEWVGLLKSCTAFEAYCKTFTANVQPARVAEFLILSEEFPRSVRFSVGRMQDALGQIARSAASRGSTRLERLSGRLRATLDYGQVDEIMADSLHDYLADVRRQCAQIHTAIYQTYISYPIEAALAQAELISNQ